jgi:FHS family L-fucose permease-like MFS transporter
MKHTCTFLIALLLTPLAALHGGTNDSVFSLWREAVVANAPVFAKYLPFIGLCWLLFQFGRAQAGRTLTIFSMTVVALLLTAIIVGGPMAMWCAVAIGLFTSIGWSNTFSLALEGTGIAYAYVAFYGAKGHRIGRPTA